MVSAYLYVLMMLTDYMGDNAFRIEQGTVLVVIIMTNVALNILKLINNLYFATIKHCKRKIMLREKEERKKKEEAYLLELH